MAKKDKKGKDIVEYPKLIKVGDKKVRVLNAEEEAKLDLPVEKVKEEKKSGAWSK